MNNGIGYGVPALYDHINVATALENPSTVHVKNTALCRYFERYLLQKAMSVFEWKIPENWDKSYFLYVLYCWGFLSVVKTDKFGVIPQACGLRGYDVFYRPTHAIITNPLLTGILEPRIDVQCTVFKLQPDYCGIMDVVSYYAEMLAMCAEGAALNIFNSKLGYVFASKDKTTAESFKKMFDKIASGDPAVFPDKNLFDDNGDPAWMTFTQNLKENYIAGAILDDMRKWEYKFDTEIGIPNSNTEKKERMIVDEVNSNNVEVRTRCDLWLEELKKAAEKTNKMFGTDISVNWRQTPGGDEDGSK